MHAVALLGEDDPRLPACKENKPLGLHEQPIDAYAVATGVRLGRKRRGGHSRGAQRSPVQAEKDDLPAEKGGRPQAPRHHRPQCLLEGRRVQQT